MAKAKKKQEPDVWADYDSVQLTPEQKAKSREILENQKEEAARNKVWEQFLEIEGKLRLQYDLDALREDREAGLKLL